MESGVRHLHWAARRNKVFCSFMRTGQPHRRREAFTECGGESWVRVRKDGSDVKIVCNHCHDRFCDACQRERAGKIERAVSDHLETRTTRFVTLTMRASHTPLADQISGIYRNFSVLRRRKWWAEHVTGGAAFLECKIGANSGAWHVHLHILCEGQFLPQKELSDEWYRVTLSSYIVDVRAVPDAPARARYVTKYVTKPADASVFANPTRLDEFVIAMRGRRLCLTFGSWRGLQLDPETSEDDDWVRVGSLETVVSRACEYDTASTNILYALCRKYPNLIPTIAALNVRCRGAPPN